ncbi:hypothetical protein F5Y11DRAFT_346626 [Daldinia sp. FL1419]|nr:hypothetical protein F5Y11DRAFT_346626 [Daldinia sp. FL1419]
MSQNPRDGPPSQDRRGRPPQAPKQFGLSNPRGARTPIPGVDSPLYYPRDNNGVYDAAFYPNTPIPQQAASQSSASVTPTQPGRHFYGCACASCVAFYHPSNHFSRGSHAAAGSPSTQYVAGTVMQPPGTGVYALDQAGMQALNKQAHSHVAQTALQQQQTSAPQALPFPPEFHPASSRGQASIQDGQQTQGSYFNERELKEIHNYQKRKENEERDKRIQRYREQHERAAGFHESDDDEFIPNIRNP